MANDGFVEKCSKAKNTNILHVFNNIKSKNSKKNTILIVNVNAEATGILGVSVKKK
jgi:hypothetical protein